MVFNSIEFAIFLPIVFLFYWTIFNSNFKLQNLFLVVVSYIFYGWWNWKCLFLIVFTSFCSWGSGLLIEKYRGSGKKSKWTSVTNNILNLAILGVFKYYDFFVTSFANAFLGGKTDVFLLNIILPVGISFYTFQAISYSIDVYKGKLIPTKDIVEFFAFVSFFPQLVAGPIERATNLLPQFQRKRVFDYLQAVDGCRQILWGLFKKMVVADNCAVYVDYIFGGYQDQSGSTLLLAAVLFTFQIYGDFSGYSDVAIGTSKLFGIKLMRNFNVPYFSRDIAEFWRRWHISLTTWFRDYLYIPLGGSRCSKWKVARNTLIIFVVSGLWHGANWKYVFWGSYHAILFLPLILLGINRKYNDVVASGHDIPNTEELFKMLLTFFLVVIGWIFFRSESLKDAINFIHRICEVDSFRFFYRFFYSSGSLRSSWAVIFMLIIEWFSRNNEHALYALKDKNYLVQLIVYIGIIYVIIINSAISSPQFIYFQF